MYTTIILLFDDTSIFLRDSGVLQGYILEIMLLLMLVNLSKLSWSYGPVVCFLQKFHNPDITAFEARLVSEIRFIHQSRCIAYIIFLTRIINQF